MTPLSDYERRQFAVIEHGLTADRPPTGMSTGPGRADHPDGWVRLPTLPLVLLASWVLAGLLFGALLSGHVLVLAAASLVCLILIAIRRYPRHGGRSAAVRHRPGSTP